MKRHLMRIDKGSKRIMNLTLFQYLEKASALKLEVGGSDEQAK